MEYFPRFPLRTHKLEWKGIKVHQLQIENFKYDFFIALEYVWFNFMRSNNIFAAIFINLHFQSRRLTLFLRLPVQHCTGVVIVIHNLLAAQSFAMHIEWLRTVCQKIKSRRQLRIGNSIRKICAAAAERRHTFLKICNSHSNLLRPPDMQVQRSKKSKLLLSSRLHKETVQIN